MKINPWALALGALVLVVIVVLLVGRPPPPTPRPHRDPGSLPGGLFPPGTHTGGECGTSSDCPKGMYCYQGYCFYS